MDTVDPLYVVESKFRWTETRTCQKNIFYSYVGLYTIWSKRITNKIRDKLLPVYTS